MFKKNLTFFPPVHLRFLTAAGKRHLSICEVIKIQREHKCVNPIHHLVHFVSKNCKVKQIWCQRHE